MTVTMLKDTPVGKLVFGAKPGMVIAIGGVHFKGLKKVIGGKQIVVKDVKWSLKEENCKIVIWNGWEHYTLTAVDWLTVFPSVELSVGIKKTGNINLNILAPKGIPISRLH